jgi:ankyrin repeat protein
MLDSAQLLYKNLVLFFHLWVAKLAGVFLTSFADGYLSYYVGHEDRHFLPLRPVREDGLAVIECLARSHNMPEDLLLKLIDCGLVTRLLNHEVDNGNTTPAIRLCYWAASAGYYEGVARLLDLGLVIPADYPSFSHPLSIALSKGDPKLVRVLLERGASGMVGRNQRWNSSSVFSAWLSVAYMVAIIPKSASEDTLQRYDEILLLLLEHGADINAGFKFEQSALCWAAEGGFVGILETLLANGADPNLEDSKGRIPLHFPVYCGDKVDDIVKRLIPVTADINHPDHDGTTPLIDMARNKTNIGAVKLLVKAGANVRAVSRTKGTALQNSTWYCSMEMMGYLINAGADPNVAGGGRPSSLMAVSSLEFDAPDLISFLLVRGARAYVADSTGQTALHVVLEQAAANAPDSVCLLLDHGADVNAIWEREQKQNAGTDEPIKVTPLELVLTGAAELDLSCIKDELVGLLLSRGASPKLLSVDGQQRLEQWELRQSKSGTGNSFSLL